MLCRSSLLPIQAISLMSSKRKQATYLMPCIPHCQIIPASYYLIHTYDYPELAHQALGVARRYAAVALSSAHALHMPSHIFTRLGLWDECIQSNLASVSSAKCYATSTGIIGHWDEELHGLTTWFMHTCKKVERFRKIQLEYLNTIKEVHPVNFKVAYARTMLARFALRIKIRAAAALPIISANIS
jgi:hypothetical protein